MEYLELAAKVLALPAAVGAFVGLWIQLRAWRRPLMIEAQFTRHFGEDGHETIEATVTNRSKASVYIVGCEGLQAYSDREVWRQHLANPLVHPRHYPVFRHRGIVFSLMKEKSVKLESQQQVVLSHRLGRDIMSRFDGPYLQIEVTLSTGRRVLSDKVKVRATSSTPTAAHRRVKK